MTTIDALVTSLSSSLVLFALFFLIFLWFSRVPSCQVIYYSARILKGHRPPDARMEGLFDALVQTVTTTEDDLAEFAGLDAAVYVRLHTTCLKILLWAMLYCIPVLLPVNHGGGLFSEGWSQALNLTYVDMDELSMSNIPAKSPSLWAHAFGVWWVSAGAIYFLSSAYAEVLTLRKRAQESVQPEPQQLAVLIRDIPKPMGRNTPREMLDSIFSRAYKNGYDRSVLVPKLKEVMSTYRAVLAAKDRLAHARALFELSRSSASEQGKRPRHRTGFLGLIGPEVDSMETYNDEALALVRKLKVEQEKVAEDVDQVRAAVALFSSRAIAASASQAVLGSHVDKWVLQAAPEPEDIVWENLAVPILQRQTRTIVVAALVVGLIFFYMIPITFIAGLTTLENLEKTLPFLTDILNNPTIATILEAYLPQLALITFLAVLPYILYFLSCLEALPSQSSIERAAIAKYYWFIVLNVFLGVTLSGGIFGALYQIVNENANVVDLLGASIPERATFFISYIALSFLVGLGLYLSQLTRLIPFAFSRQFLCVTEKELREAWNPGRMPYLYQVPADLLVITLALCYSVIAPIILPFAAMYNVFGWIIMKHLALNIHSADYESHGRMFPQIHDRIVAAMFIAQLSLIGFFSLKQFYGTFCLLPLPILTFVYFRYASSAYFATFKTNFFDLLANPDSEVPPAMEAVEAAYLPPCLKRDDGKLDPASRPWKSSQKEIALVGLSSQNHQLEMEQ
eukprot:TRINITY_DN22607_c0_g1_i1.p1 TRINITY_DN22607_c0_g1~~TRINITY_DN22607_c0_g1_i1.p1  ORF type:complete len:739 (-),score=125.16 TRINITY_DN22607_c0_g1_i1:392-2608(-)